MLKQSRKALTCLAKRYCAELRRCRLRALALALACALTALPPLPAGAENTGGTWSGNDYIGTPTIGEASGATVDIDSDVPGSVYGGETASGDATSNTVIISGGTVSGYVYGGDAGDGNATSNRVIISGGTMGDVCGGLAVDSGNATSNRVIISGGTVSGYVYGGETRSGDATSNTVIMTGGTVAASVVGGNSFGGVVTGNTVIISGGTVGDVYGGHTGDGNATSNTVIISGGTVGYVYGGGTGSGNATSNRVIISGGTVAGDVYGGDAPLGNGIATGNRVILSGAPTLTGIIYGGDAAADAVSGNLLEVRSSGLQAKNIANFAEYAFQLPADIRPGAVLLTLTQATDLTNGGRSPSPDIQRIDVAGAASPLRVGDKVTLFRNDNGLTPGTLPTSVSGTQGVTLAYTYALSTTSTTLDATVTDTRFNPQTKALAEGHVSGTALALQGADLAAGKGLDAAGQAVRASRAGGGRGVAAFGALSGGWSRYNTGSHIDVSGFSLLTGLAWGADSVLGQFTSGMFFEYGSASTGTYNSFSNAASVSGDGSTWYMGGGLLARMDFNDCGPGHIYAEASGRAGVLNNSYRNDDLRDADGRRAEFDTSTPYVSLHAGLGYIWNLTDALSLDLHAKYFWTWQDSADTDLSTGEALHFDAVNSHRLRLGGRLTYAVNEHISPYVGAAWEHEFDGTARATTLGYDLDAPSLKGDTGIGELGLSWTPSATTPLTIDLSVQGYTGVREGYTGSFMAKWEF